MRIKIHPAIGIARVGNSPDDFFIGPEKPNETFSAEQLDETDPQKFRYKDSQGRIKRQAARFRLFSYDDDGAVIKELKPGVDNIASITWKVHLKNLKGAGPRFFDLKKPHRLRNEDVSDRESLKIDPGLQSITGKGQGPVVLQGKFLGETVILGDLRTDPEGRLLVLGGFGKARSPVGKPLSIESVDFADHDGWYDDVSDGSVKATVTFTDGSQNTEIVGAWVIVGPPDFAPPLSMITTLYDTLFQLALDKQLAYLDSGETLSVASKPSFKKEIAPILRRAIDMRWVLEEFKPNAEFAAPHNTFNPFFPPQSQGSPAIFSRLRDPDNPEDASTDMPRLWGDLHHKGPKLTVTKTQYLIMKKWAGTFQSPGLAGVDWINDWDQEDPPEPINPRGLDRAGIESCLGGAFYPGVEASIFIRDGAKYKEPFRLDPDTAPGSLTEGMALPWKGDFYDCRVETDGGLNIYWWPAQRPDFVVFEENGALQQDKWTRSYVSDMDTMVSRWHHLGFVIQKGDKYLEAERNHVEITWPTSPLSFKAEEGYTVSVPIDIQVKSNMSVTFQITNLTPANFSAAVAQVDVPASDPPETKTARLWIQFKDGVKNQKTLGKVALRAFQTDFEECVFGDKSQIVSIEAQTIEHQTCATVLVLDRSGSMNEQVSADKKKIDKLREAATTFVQLMQDGDGVGLVQYNDQAEMKSDLLEEVVKIDKQSGQTVADIINSKENLVPQGETSIGAGILLGNTTLASAKDNYPRHALLVLTDGKENHPPTIASAREELKQSASALKIYAVGIGKPEDISYTALHDLTTPSSPTPEEDAAQGYLLVTGDLSDDKFRLQKYFLQVLANINVAEIVLDPAGELSFGSEQRIPFNMTEADKGMDVILLNTSPRALDFRLETPSGKIIDKEQALQSTAVKFAVGDAVSFYRLRFASEILSNDHAGLWHAVLSFGNPDQSSFKNVASAASTQSIPYSLVVHGYSDLRLKATMRQQGHEPGSELLFRALLTEFGMPLAKGGRVWAEVTDPHLNRSEVLFQEVAPGQFEASMRAEIEGVYNVRLRAAGETSGRYIFSREQMLTPGIWRKDGRGQGGDDSLRGCLRARPGCLPRFLRRLFSRH